MNRQKLSSGGRHLGVTLLLIVTLGGCGGGGGGSDEGASGPTNPSVTSSNLQELKIHSSNELRVNQPLEVNIEMTSSRSFMSICPDPGTSLSVQTMNYDLCVVRVPLQAGFRTLTLDVANHVDALVAIIWFYEADRFPQVFRWQRETVKGAAIGEVWRISELNQ